jgi:lactoylglutathione lyase
MGFDRGLLWLSEEDVAAASWRNALRAHRSRRHQKKKEIKMVQTDIRLVQIGFVMLGVGDLNRSVSFYRDKLGLSVKQEIPGFAFLDGGGVTLCLSQPLARTSGPAAGAMEIVFSVEDVRAAYEALRGRGVQFIQEPRNVSGAMWAANFEDPDGHRLSIFGPERKA